MKYLLIVFLIVFNSCKKTADDYADLYSVKPLLKEIYVLQMAHQMDYKIFVNSADTLGFISPIQEFYSYSVRNQKNSLGVATLKEDVIFYAEDIKIYIPKGSKVCINENSEITSNHIFLSSFLKVMFSVECN